MKVLFVLASPEYLRYYDETIRLLASRGHRVAVAINNQRDRKPVRLDGIESAEGRIAVLGLVPRRRGIWGRIGKRLRGITDYLRYLHPRFADATALRVRMKRKALHPAFHFLDRIQSIGVTAHRRLLAVLAALEWAVPTSRAIEAYVRAESPDAILVSPLVDAASDQVELVKTALTLGIPVGACIASWDNLTNKGLLRVQPDAVIVWNELQKSEAIEFHGVAPQKVIVTGAQPFDRWFERRPGRARDAFCARVGLPVDSPFVMFTCSSGFISASHAEIAFVRDWIRALRVSESESVSKLAVLVRPHPYNALAWETSDFSDLEGVAIFPTRAYNPVDESNRTDYFDSLFHSAAVVGINTSAMVEAAILGKPVFSIVTSEFAGTQEGTLHFRYLLPENGGCVRLGRTFEEHVAQLAGALADPQVARDETRRFVEGFIRPQGRGQPSTPRVADAIENIARTRVEPWRPIWPVMLRPVLLLAALYAATYTLITSAKIRARLLKLFRLRAHRTKKGAARIVRMVVRRRKKVFRLRASSSRSMPELRIALLSRRIMRGFRRLRYTVAVGVRRRDWLARNPRLHSYYRRLFPSGDKGP